MNLDDLIAATAAREASGRGLTPEATAAAIVDHLTALAHYGPHVLGRLVDQLQREDTPRATVERATLARLIHPDAVEAMRRDHAPYPDRECAWILRRGPDGRGVDPILWARGRRDRVPCPPAAVDTIIAHSHPAGSDLEPSAADLTAATAALTLRRTGFLIVDAEVTRAYAVVEGHNDHTLAMLASIYDKTPLLEIGGADGNA
ncbi:MAG: hypothetical protein IT352_15785 [Gemmatimonadales bacterium]|nr:hypothetical protein [Gemmatimonadales bacterium]